MVYVFLAEGFEEAEALVPVDILRRGEVEVATVGVTGKTVTGSHGIPVVCDVMACEIMPDETCEAVILPGGMPGTLNLEKSPTVQQFVDYANENDIVLGAICAAPSILGHKGILNGKKATCYMGFEEQLFGAEICEEPVCVDGKIITAFGAGAAFDFGFAILTAVTGNDKESKVNAAAMKYKR